MIRGLVSDFGFCMIFVRSELEFLWLREVRVGLLMCILRMLL